MVPELFLGEVMNLGNKHYDNVEYPNPPASKYVFELGDST